MRKMPRCAPGSSITDQRPDTASAGFLVCSSASRAVIDRRRSTTRSARRRRLSRRARTSCSLSETASSLRAISSDASTARRTPPRSASRAPAASFLSIGWILAWIGATPSNDGGHYAKKKGGEAAASPPMSRSDQTSVRGSSLRGLEQRAVDLPFDFLLVQAVDDGDLGDDQVLRPLVHLLLAKGERLARHDVVQALQDVGDVVETPALHLVEILFVPPLPVTRRGEPVVRQPLHEPGDVLALREPAQADQVGIPYRNHDLRVVGQKTQVIEAARSGRLRCESLPDLLDHGNPMVGIDNLLSHSESHHYVLLKCIKDHARLLRKQGRGAHHYRENGGNTQPARGWTVSLCPRKP